MQSDGRGASGHSQNTAWHTVGPRVLSSWSPLEVRGPGPSPGYPALCPETQHSGAMKMVTLAPYCWDMNPGSSTSWLCDLGPVALPLCTSVSLSVS